MANTETQVAQVAGVDVEYRLDRQMVIFSPGFGVCEGSPGMALFRDIISILPAGVGYVLFSYCDEDDRMVTVKGTEEDAERLLNVLAWVRQRPGVEGVSIVAHSRGCIDAAVADMYPLNSVVMLAPPLWGGFARFYFTNRPGVVKRGDDWYVPRSDGTTSIMPERIFDEYDTLRLDDVILNYAERQPLRVIVAGADGVLGQQDFGRLLTAPNIKVVTIPGASHDFEGDARSVLLQKLGDYISKDLLDA